MTALEAILSVIVVIAPLIVMVVMLFFRIGDKVHRDTHPGWDEMKHKTVKEMEREWNSTKKI